MIPTPWLLITIASLIILTGLAFTIISRKYPQKKFTGKHPEGYFVNKGMAVFLAVGLAMGVALDNIAIGIAVGVVIGAAMGSAWEKKAEKEGKIRPMTKDEKARKDISLKFVLGIGFLMLILMFICFLITR